MDWGQFLSGLLAMEVEVKIAATVMVMLLVLTQSQLALSVRETASHGIWRGVHLHLPQPIAVETELRNKL